MHIFEVHTCLDNLNNCLWKIQAASSGFEPMTSGVYKRQLLKLSC